MSEFIPNNLNTKNTDAVSKIAIHYRDIMSSSEIEWGEIKYQIIDSDLNIRIGFRNGFILILKDDKVTDFTGDHISIDQAIEGARLIKPTE